MAEMDPNVDALPVTDEQELTDSRAWQAEHLRLLWDRRKFFLRAILFGLVASTLVAFLIPKSYTSTTQLMPPDSQSTSGMAMMAALAGKAGGGLESLAGDLLGVKSSGSLFIGVLRSQTAQDRLIQQFDLKEVYGKSLEMDARTKLDENTAISEDKKSGIITISVTDRSPQRATALATAYVDQLNSLVAGLSTSAAHRERVFLEERLKVVKARPGRCLKPARAIFQQEQHARYPAGRQGDVGRCCESCGAVDRGGIGTRRPSSVLYGQQSASAIAERASDGAPPGYGKTERSK